jgi:hypothetical protein
MTLHLLRIVSLPLRRRRPLARRLLVLSRRCQCRNHSSPERLRRLQLFRLPSLVRDRPLRLLPHPKITNLGNTLNETVGSALLIDYALLTTTVGAAGCVDRGFSGRMILTGSFYSSTLANTTIEDTDRSRLTYIGTWDSNKDTRFSGGTSTYTNEEASVSLKFNGSAVYVFGDTVDVRRLFFRRGVLRVR